MERLTYFDSGKWRMRMGDTEYSGEKVDRISAYEDILDGCDDIDRLQELVEADKDGRCVVLPCHIGDQVYYIANVVSQGYPDPDIKPELFLRPFKIEWIYGIGKFVFTDRESAEAALAKEAK